MKQILLVLGLIIVELISYGQSAKVVGYLPSYRFSLSGSIEYCKLTHLNLAFANPNRDGDLVMPDIGSVMSDALNDNPSIIICISLAGGGLTQEQKEDWSYLIDTPANRPAFITKIVDYVQANNLDGVDMDLEWDAVTEGYSEFVIELYLALNAHNKILTVALPNQTRFSNISDDAFQIFDFINIMSYDATGPWDPSRPGQHSSYSFASNGINFWKNTVGIAGNKLMLGVPFYGYDFVSSSLVNAATYASIVATNSSYADIDKVGNFYYNGRPTIESKVTLANTEVAGIMIWEVGQDSFDEYSLLNTIHNKFTSLGITTSGLCGNEIAVNVSELETPNNYKLYPNPSSDFLMVKHNEPEQPKTIIRNTLGQTMNVVAKSNHMHELIFDVSKLRHGIYFLTLIDKNQAPQTHKFIVN